MKYIKLALISILLLGAAVNTNAITIHTIGDSTMADYDENTTDKRGWGMMFQQFFKEGLTINNRAKSGASSKSFYQEAPYWETVKKQIEAGDYVLIQFAHNDEKNNGLDGDSVRATTDPEADYRGTTAQGTFKFYLRAYVNETRELGATPVFVSAMCRKYFSSGQITRTGRHDLGEKFGVGEDNHDYDYSYAMKQVAEEMNVQFIDITSLTKTLFESYGDAACTELLFCNDDSTHPNALGGTLVARLCAQDMVAQNILAEYVNTSSDLLVNPTAANFGDAYVGQTLTKEFTVSGFDLSPAEGTFTISCSDGFTIAANKTDVYSSSITLNYANGNLDFSRFYVQTTLTAAGLTSGSLTLTNGSVTKTVSLQANAILLTGGTEVNLIWSLSSNTDYTLTGPAMPVDESWSEMYVQRYAAPNAAAVWPEESGYDASHITQRNLLVGDAWPAGEIDEVSTRYVQFGIAANIGTELNIDSIGLYVCGAGGNGMRCRISYSIDNFSTPKVVQEFSSMVANNMYAVSAIPVVKLEDGDTLLLRVYPWYSGAATGKTICLADVCIHAMATSTTSVSERINKNSITYYIADGELILKGIEGKSQINIYNLLGELIERTSSNTEAEVHIPVSLKQGIYLCSIKTASGYEVIKYRIE